MSNADWVSYLPLLYQNSSFLPHGINCVADVVRRGRLRWFGHLERKSVDDWVSACRGLVVEGARGRGRSRKTWEQCVRDDMKLLGLHSEWAIFKDMWRDFIWGKHLTLA